MMAIRVGPMNRPKKPKARKPPKTPRMVSGDGISTKILHTAENVQDPGKKVY